MHNTYYKSKKAKITERACYSITIDTYNSIITIILYNGAPHPTLSWYDKPQSGGGMHPPKPRGRVLGG